MDKVRSSFTILVLFLMEYPILLCLPYGGEFKPVELATDLMSTQPPTCLPYSHPCFFHHWQHTSCQKRVSASPFPHLPAIAPLFSAFLPFQALIPHRSALVQVIVIACVAFSIALICGITISYVIYRLVQAEERQQLVWLYNNVRIPFLEDEDEVSEDESQDESTYLLPENEKELEKFIHSVIRSKRRKRMENKRLKNEQMFIQDTKLNNSLHSVFSENL
uniref:Chromosome 19 open reading frame 18 n=1 Tax=Canis lupus dingo TaxID=286419 RepID=A0A8C0KPY3_CANLU